MGRGTWVSVADDVGFDVHRGEVVALVGESGSGKTVTALSIIGLLGERGGRISRGSITFDGVELTRLNKRAYNRIRGSRVGMIFQQPVKALNPAFSVGHQISETVRAHTGASRRQAWALAVEMLGRVHIANAERRAHDYPHMLSGGMCQRVMIAQALACKPALLIADEPTTSLDVTIQARIIELLREIQDDTGISILLISHDLGVVAEIADSIAVMYGGMIVETGAASSLLSQPLHPYTDALIGAIPTARTHRLVTVPGTVPFPGALPDGCLYWPRCSFSQAGICDREVPTLRGLAPGRRSRCVRAEAIYFGR